MKRALVFFVIIIIIFIWNFSAGASLTSGAVINDYVKRMPIPDVTAMAQPFALFERESNLIVLWDSLSLKKRVFVIDKDMNIKKTFDFGNRKLGSILKAATDDGRYLAIYLNDRGKNPLILYDKKGKMLWERDLGEYCKKLFVTNGNNYIFCEIDDDVNRSMSLLKFDLKGNIVSKLVLGGEPWIKISEDGNLVNIRFPLWIDKKIDKGVIVDLKGQNIFKQLEKEGVVVFDVSPKVNYFMGYENGSKKLCLIGKNGNVVWKKPRSSVGNCTFSADEKYILGTSAFISDQATPKSEKKLFMYDISGRLLWELNMDYDRSYCIEGLPNSMDASGKYISVLTNIHDGKVFKGRSIVCLDRNGVIVWQTPPLDIVSIFVSKDGEWIYGIGSEYVYKFNNIAIK